MKKSVISIFIFLALIGFVSAADFSDLLDQLDQSFVILGAIFLLSFILIHFALSKSMFKKNQTFAGLVAGILAFLITYGVNKADFDFEGFFIDIGISESAISLAVSLVLLAGIIFAIIKLKTNSLWLFGILIFFLGFLVYEGTILFTIGILLIIVRFVIMAISGKKKRYGGQGNNPAYA